MHIHHILSVAALAAACAAPAGAMTFEGSTSQGATVVTDYAANGLVSFDIDFANFAGASVEYRVDDVDMGAALSFNAVLRNFTNLGFGGFTLALSQGSFATAGSVTRQFGGTALVNVAGGIATLSFNTPEFLDVELGNALGTTPAASDWTITGLQSGDRFSITVSPVPEPGSMALLLAGLGCVGFIARRRRAC